MRLIDAHIHLDMYTSLQRRQILSNLATQKVDYLICVSNDYDSAFEILRFAKEDHRIKPTFGYHPEQPLPKEGELEKIIDFIQKNEGHMVAIGEVGLPYYLRKKNPLIDMHEYIALLETFIQLAVKLNKPVVLHAIYEDAHIACELLERYEVKKAHFHWFKGDKETLLRIINNDYVISVTPDISYETSIQKIVQQTPMKNLLVETDGPWPFEGPFNGEVTHPGMMHETMKMIAYIKGKSLQKVYEEIYTNTYTFYQLEQ